MAAPRGSVLLLAHVRDRGVVTAARALARAGWRVGVGSPRRDGGLVGASRAVAQVHVVPRPTGDGDAFVAGVRAAQAQGGYDVVVGSGDDWMSAVSYYRDALPLPVAHPPRDVVTAAMDRVTLSRVAEQVGVTTPLTQSLPISQDERLGAPVVVKNRSHWAPGQHRRHRIEAKVCPTEEQLQAHLLDFGGVEDEPVLQEMVHGHLSALVGVMHQGRLIGRVAQISPRLWPTPSGASARAITVPVDPDLASRSEALLRELGWTGLVELQFLVPSDGIPRLIDLNGRFYGSLALAERSRPGLVDASLRGAVGLPVPELADGLPGVRYHWLPGDLRRAVRERRGGLAADVLATLSWSPGAQHSLLCTGDPGPLLDLLGGRLGPDRGDDAPSVSANGPGARSRERRIAQEPA